MRSEFRVGFRWRRRPGVRYPAADWRRSLPAESVSLWLMLPFLGVVPSVRGLLTDANGILPLVIRQGSRPLLSKVRPLHHRAPLID